MSEQAFLQSPKIPCPRKGGSFSIQGKFVRTEEDPEGYHEQSWWFCGTSMRDCFDLPMNTKAVQFRAFTEPGPGRWEIKFGTAGTDEVCCRARYEGEGEAKLYWLDDDTLDRDIFGLLGRRRKTWYVEVFYWV